MNKVILPLALSFGFMAISITIAQGQVSKQQPNWTLNLDHPQFFPPDTNSDSEEPYKVYNKNIIKIPGGGMIHLYEVRYLVTNKRDQLGNPNTTLWKTAMVLTRVNACHQVVWSKKLKLSSPFAIHSSVIRERAARMIQGPGKTFYLVRPWENRNRISIARFNYQGRQLWAKNLVPREGCSDTVLFRGNNSNFPETQFNNRGMRVVRTHDSGLLLKYEGKAVGDCLDTMPAPIDSFTPPPSKHYTAFAHIKPDGTLPHQTSYYTTNLEFQNLKRAGKGWFMGLFNQAQAVHAPSNRRKNANQKLLYFDEKGVLQRTDSFFYANQSQTYCCYLRIGAIEGTPDSSVFLFYATEGTDPDGDHVLDPLDGRLSIARANSAGQMQWHNAFFSTDGGSIFLTGKGYGLTKFHYQNGNLKLIARGNDKNGGINLTQVLNVDAITGKINRIYENKVLKPGREWPGYAIAPHVPGKYSRSRDNHLNNLAFFDDTTMLFTYNRPGLPDIGRTYFPDTGSAQSRQLCIFREFTRSATGYWLKNYPEVPLKSVTIPNKFQPRALKPAKLVSATNFRWQKANVSANPRCGCVPYHYQCPELGSDTLLCTDTTYRLRAGPDTSLLQYHWNTGDSANAITIDSSGRYIVTISNDTCSTKDSIKVVFLRQYPARFPNDTLACRGDSFALSAPDTNTAYRYLPAGTDSFRNGKTIQSLDTWVHKPGHYALYLDTFSRCPIAQFRFKPYQAPAVSLADTTICPADSLTTGADTLNHTGWVPLQRPSDTLPAEVTFGDTGTYQLTHTRLGCPIDTFRLSRLSYKPALPAGDTLCPKDSLQLLADTSQPISYAWAQPSNTRPTSKGFQITASDTGRYDLFSLKPACRLDSFELLHHRLPDAQTGPDTTLCLNQAYTLNGKGGVTYQWKPARFLSSDSIADPTAKLPNKQDYKLIVKNQAGCSDTTHLSLSVRNPLKVAITSPDTSVCPGQPVRLKARGSGGDSLNYHFEWQQSGKEGAAVKQQVWRTGKYTVRLSDNCTSPDAYDTVQLSTKPTPEAAFTTEPPDTLLLDQAALLINQSRYDAGITWLIGNEPLTRTADTIRYAFRDTGTKTLRLSAKRRNGCHDTAKGTLYVQSAFRVFIPDAFTPNGDGINDQWRVKGLGIRGIAVQVFNRWGERVFRSFMDENAAWDGTYKGELVPQGIYLYRLTAMDNQGKEHHYSGEIQVIR